MKTLAVIFGVYGIVGLFTAQVGAGLLSLLWAGVCLYAEHRSKKQINPPT